MFDLPTWQKSKQQRLLGSDYIVIDPSNKLEEETSQLEFEVNNSAPLLFGPMSKFHVEGRFDTKANDAADWANATADEVANVLLAPNWFEMLIKSIDVFNNNQRISASNEACFIPAHLNSMMYAYMEPTAKKLLCPQPEHPGYCVPVDKDPWKIETEPYTKYAKLVFGKKNYFHLCALFSISLSPGVQFSHQRIGAKNGAPAKSWQTFHQIYFFRQTGPHFSRKTQQ